MLQQTQVATVIPYWSRFLQRFPTVAQLAEAPLEDVLSAWRGLGYYGRARMLHKAARAVVTEFGGALPQTAQQLMELPGFGRYTAGAVASIAFGEEAPILDGNAARVFCRLFGVEGAPGDRARDKALWEWAALMVKGDRPGDFNQAVMELGATLCKPESPLCLLCPARAFCEAHRQGKTHELPPPKMRAQRKPLALAVGVFWKRGRVLLARRKESGLWGGLWELPSVEIAPTLQAEEIRARLEKALGKGVKVGAAMGEVKRTLTHRDLKLLLHPASGTPSDAAALGYGESRWATPEETLQLGISTAMQKALSFALERRARA
jgi:A/G-specific adenine glycosylase